jgi:hypothetical protein
MHHRQGTELGRERHQTMIERYSQNALNKSTTLNHHAMIKKILSTSYFIS